MSIIKYLSKSRWDDQAYLAGQLIYSFISGVFLFALSMTVIEIRKSGEDRIEWVRREKRDDEELEKIREQRKHDLEFAY